MIGLGFGNFQSVTQEPFSFGNALKFDGTNDFVNFGNSSDFVFGNGVSDSAFSVGFWVNMADATGCRMITRVAGSNRSWYLITGGSDNLQFILNTNSSNYIGRSRSTAMTSFEGSWIYLICTYDGSAASSGINIYIGSGGSITAVDDGDVNFGTYTTMNVSSIDMKMAAFDASYADATFDELSFWSSELSAAEITSIYNGGSFIDITSDNGNYVSSANLTHYWKYNEINPTATAFAETGAINGTLNNFNFDANSGWVAH